MSVTSVNTGFMLRADALGFQMDFREGDTGNTSISLRYAYLSEIDDMNPKTLSESAKVES